MQNEQIQPCIGVDKKNFIRCDTFQMGDTTRNGAIVFSTVSIDCFVAC